MIFYPRFDMAKESLFSGASNTENKVYLNEMVIICSEGLV